MSTTLEELAHLDGVQVLEIGGNRPFAADSAEGVWVVERGFVDLFMMPFEGDQSAGARFHLLKLVAGTCFPTIARQGETGILVVGTVDARLLRIPKATVDALPTESPSAVLLHKLLESWVQQVGRYIDPASAATALAGSPWATLAELHRRFLQAAQERESAARERQAEQLQRQETQNEAVVRQALVNLASVLRDDNPPGYTPGSGDALLAACRLVGDVTGTTIKPPAPSSARDGTDRLAAIGRASGILMRRVILRGNWWTGDCGPLLAYLENGHQPVALVPRDPAHYDLIDPAQGTTEPVTAAVAERLEPVAYVFSRPFMDGPVKVRDLVRFTLQGTQKELMWVVGVALAGSILGLAIPVATDLVIGTVIPSGVRHELFDLSLGLFACALGKSCYDLTRSVALIRMKGRISLDVQGAVIARLLTLQVPFFRKYNSGDLALRATAINNIRDALTGATLSTVLGVVFSSVNVFLLFYYNWILALFGMALVGTVASFTLLCGYFQIGVQKRMTGMQGRLANTVYEFIVGISKLRVARAEPRAFAEWSRLFAQMRKITFRVRMFRVAMSVFSAGFPIVCSLTLFIVMAWLNYTVPPSTFLAFNASLGQLTGAMLSLGSVLGSLMAINSLLGRVRPLLKADPEINRARPDVGMLEGSVAMDRVTFRYSNDGPAVLKNLSFHVKPGEFVAFVGPSGCGKSTMLRQLLGFEKPETGTVTYDTQDIQRVDIQAVRRQIGVVLQAGSLMPGDIFTNIVGTSLLTIDDAWEAARIAGIEDDIKAMPMGMNTVISEGASTLSGGQRQRLMIARALVGGPRYLFLDEATSALDSRVQDEVSRRLERLKVTRVVIAHRLSTIRSADRIYVMSGGSIVQQGTYKELIGQPGLFSELARRQLA